jgi:hypothetical protein
MQRIADVVFSLSVSLWLALAVVGGIAAMGIFPTARTLDISLAGYEAFLAAHPEEGRMLVAGHFAERIFMLAETPRLVCAVVAALALAVQLAASVRAPTFKKTRVAALIAAAGALAFSAFSATSAFRSLDATYRGLASNAATIADAIALKPQLDAAHALASRTMTVEVVALLVLITLSAIAAEGSRTRA